MSTQSVSKIYHESIKQKVIIRHNYFFLQTFILKWCGSSRESFPLNILSSSCVWYKNLPCEVMGYLHFFKKCYFILNFYNFLFYFMWSGLQKLFQLLRLLSSGGMAAKEPGECSQRRPVWSHSDVEEKASEHPEFYSGSAQECPLETTRPAGKTSTKHTGTLN